MRADSIHPTHTESIREYCYRKFDADIALMVSGPDVDVQVGAPESRLDEVHPKPIKHRGLPRQPKLLFSVSIHG